MTTKTVNVRNKITGLEETVPESVFNHVVLGQFLEEIDRDPNCVDCGPASEPDQPEEVESDDEEVVYFDDIEDEDA